MAFEGLIQRPRCTRPEPHHSNSTN